MFSKFFSCLADSTSNHDQVDLSRQNSNGSALPIQNKPSLPKESNINGQQIQFQDEDFLNNNLLQMHFLQQANVEARQKVIPFSHYKIFLQYYYEQDDGEGDSKITTASPSKTQHYKILNNKDDLAPNLILENQNNLLISGNEQRPDQDSSPIMKYTLNTQGVIQHQQAVSLTEKKLNNYLQQAKYLMTTQQQQQVPQSHPYQNTTEHQPILKQTLGSHKKSRGSTHVMKNYSYDTEVYSGSNSAFMHQQQNYGQQNQLPAHLQNIYSLDSCPSSKILFNALNDFKQENSAENNINKNLKASFSAQKNNSTQRRLQKLDEYKKSYSDTKKSIISHGSVIGAGISRTTHAKPIVQSKTNTLPIKKDFYAHRNSEISRSSNASNNNKIGSRISKTIAKKQIPNQIIDQFDNIIIEEQNFDGEDNNNDYLQQSYDGQLRVLDYDEDNIGNIQQIDLGSITAYNKRQTSKTEVFSPLTYPSHRKNKVSAIPNSAQKLLKTKQSSTGAHKKTMSQIQMMANGNQTRNNVFNKKHMTTTTSPNAHERTPEQPKLRQQLSLTTGKKQLSSQRQSSNNYTQPSPQKRQLASHNTLEIQEDQNEDEDCKYELQSHKSATAKFQLQQREFDIINQTISPSSSSSFQFQPKFFKPTANIVSQQSQSKLQLSMGAQEEISHTMQSQNIQNFLFRKDSHSQL